MAGRSSSRVAASQAANVPLPGRIAVQIVAGDVRQLHAAQTDTGALFRVASQFNLLEMVAPHVTPEDGVTSYKDDPTPGPACAIAAGAATIYRNYFVPIGDASGQAMTSSIPALGRKVGVHGFLFAGLSATPRPGGAAGPDNGPV
jgi:hypothetical protein